MGEHRGVVAAAYGRQFEVETGSGDRIACVARGKKTGYACGDEVLFAPQGSGQGVIEQLLPRRSLLYRSDAYRSKIIAANVTQLVLVVAPEPSAYEILLNKCLLAAEDAGIAALIAVNKQDLPGNAALLERLELYRSLGYPLLPVSAFGDIAPLRAALQGKTSVLVGQSGMGKSSLVNALLPGQDVRTGTLSAALDSGRHTTTHARLYHLDATSRLIDSPGLQEFGLYHVPAARFDALFPEFRPWLGQCRFSNCRHMAEPGCALGAAVAQGAIAARRLDCYRTILPELG